MTSDGPMLDGFGRLADDLRVSVTDRCNFRCTYCMPAAGLDWLPRDQLLHYEEIAKLVGLFASLGVRSVKITGGEPTVRADLPTLVGMLRERAPAVQLSMTTNGVLLDELSRPLADAGLDRVTVSLDSLARHRFEEMTRRDALDRVFVGIEAAVAAELTPVKVNCVIIAGTNDDELLDFARWSRQTGHDVRFIEYMPLDADEAWERGKVIPSTSILERIDTVFPLAEACADNEPATRYVWSDGAPGGIGLISSVTEPFCSTCNRLRLTSEGQFRTCLFAMDPTDLRGPLRAGASEVPERRRSTPTSTRGSVDHAASLWRLST